MVTLSLPLPQKPLALPRDVNTVCGQKTVILELQACSWSL